MPEATSATALDLPHLVIAILQLKESWACYLLKDALGDKESNFMSELISVYEFDDHLAKETGKHQQEADFFTFSHFDNYDPERGGSVNFPLMKQAVIGLNITF